MKKSLIILSVIALTSCLFDSGSDKITGHYYVVWIDISANQTISEHLEPFDGGYIAVVPEYVFAVGHNDDYIIAKQHPTNGFEGGFKVDTTITNYYIIDVNKQTDNVFGALTKTGFDSLRHELKLETIKFDMNYPDLP